MPWDCTNWTIFNSQISSTPENRVQPYSNRISVKGVLAVTDHSEFTTLVAGKQPSLLMSGNNDEVYDKKPQRYAEDNVTQW